jgi:hypothetical protein
MSVPQRQVPIRSDIVGASALHYLPLDVISKHMYLKTIFQFKFQIPWCKFIGTSLQMFTSCERSTYHSRSFNIHPAVDSIRFQVFFDLPWVSPAEGFWYVCLSQLDSMV